MDVKVAFHYEMIGTTKAVPPSKADIRFVVPVPHWSGAIKYR